MSIWTSARDRLGPILTPRAATLTAPAGPNVYEQRLTPKF